MGTPSEARERPERPTGEQIRLVREALGFSKALFARALGVSTFTVIRWENDESRMSPLCLKVYRLFLARADVQAALTRAMEREARRARRVSAA